MLVYTMNEGRPNQESGGTTTGLIKDKVDVNEYLSTVVPMQFQGEEVATAQNHHQEEGMELDPKIWSLLLEHLLENIYYAFLREIEPKKVDHNFDHNHNCP